MAAKCPYCKVSTKFSLREVPTENNRGNFQALCCLECDAIVHVLDGPQIVSNYGPLLQQILQELQALNQRN